MSSFVVQLSKPLAQELNTTSFLSQIQPSTKRTEVYLTHDDLQKRNRTRYRRFTFAYMTFLSLLIFIYAAIAFSGVRFFSQQPLICKIAYPLIVVATMAFNLVFLTILYNKYLVFLTDKTAQCIWGSKGLKSTINSSGWQIVFLSGVFYLTKCSCDRNFRLQVGLNFIFQLLQVVGMAVFGAVHYFKIFREIEMSIALDDDSVDKNHEQRADKFNGSFALNLSKRSSRSSRQTCRLVRLRTGARELRPPKSPLISLQNQ